MSTTVSTIALPASVTSITMDALLNRIELHLITLNKEQIIAAALRANFKKVDVLDMKGHYCESIAMSLLLRKYFFDACAVLFKKLPIDVFKYIGNFFDFDIKFHKRARDSVERLHSTLHEYIDVKLRYFLGPYGTDESDFANMLLQEAVLNHIKSDMSYCKQYYQMNQSRNIEMDEVSKVRCKCLRLIRQEYKINSKRIGRPAARQLFDQALVQVRTLQDIHQVWVSTISDFMQSFIASTHFAPKLRILETSELYPILVRQIAEKGLIRSTLLRWQL